MHYNTTTITDCFVLHTKCVTKWVHFCSVDEHHAMNVKWRVAAVYVCIPCMLLCCTCSFNNQGGLVQQLLSHRGWVPLSRLTFGAYLLHPLVSTITTTYYRSYALYGQLEYFLHCVCQRCSLELVTQQHSAAADYVLAVLTLLLLLLYYCYWSPLPLLLLLMSMSYTAAIAGD